MLFNARRAAADDDDDDDDDDERYLYAIRAAGMSCDERELPMRMCFHGVICTGLESSSRVTCISAVGPSYQCRCRFAGKIKKMLTRLLF